MAATTITEYKNRPCTKCGGRGNIPFFQHRNGGECFRCGATGNDPQMLEVVRPMTDDEVRAALAERGFPIIETERAPTGDWLLDLFGTDADRAAHDEMMAGARLALAAI